MSTNKSRIEEQKDEDNSFLKSFFDDQLGLLLTIVGSVPILTDYFNIIPHPTKITEISVSAINLVSVFICGILIITIYGERNKLTNAKKVHIVLLGFLLMILGFSLLLLYTYKGFFFNNNSISVYRDLIIRLDFWMGGLLILLSLIVGILLLLFTMYATIYDSGKTKQRQEKENYSQSAEFTRNFISYKKTLNFLIIVSIIAILYLSFRSIIMQYFPYINPEIKIKSRTVSFIHTLLYFAYYPLILIGAVITLSVILKSYEGKRNFYQNINRLNKNFYNPIERIVENLANFEIWFDANEKKDVENFLESSNTKDYFFSKRNRQEHEQLSGKWESSAGELFAERAQRHFLWRAIRTKLNHYAQRIDQLGSTTGRNLTASGNLIDEIVKKLPFSDDTIKEFNAVSWNDLLFWQRRGEEYLSWSKEMIDKGIKVKRVFLLNSSKDIIGKNDDDFRDNLDVLFDQIMAGILIGICYVDSIKSYDGGTFASGTEYDFGFFPNFGVTFFEKPLRVGGRSFKMLFDEEAINNYSEFFNKILKGCVFCSDINNGSSCSIEQIKENAIDRINDLARYLKEEDFTREKIYIIEEAVNKREIDNNKKQDIKSEKLNFEILPTDIEYIDTIIAIENDAKHLIRCWDKDRHELATKGIAERHFSIIDVTAGTVVGYAVLTNINDDDHSVKLQRVVVSSTNRENGYGSQMLDYLKQIVFDEMGMHRFWLEVKASNRNGILFYTKQGFKVEGYLRDSFLNGEEYETLALMSLLRREFKYENADQRM
ncbi:GNAT family N-acetyltransferase [Spirosoma validum]|uniref:GNAT family N-acetyltransferase n=1 Tax=Spirosoma validum TaxID=2771355 RepID=A0A927GDG5_9BACT|nr:GNAT family N-acetyltransferase [Spirosoma validum]MBD2753772.1 GNAT family N-acetyltransferase [Spirosoma validum]